MNGIYVVQLFKQMVQPHMNCSYHPSSPNVFKLEKSLRASVPYIHMIFLLKGIHKNLNRIDDWDKR